MKVTLEDVAQEAGVSRATVDRVLNDRGNVKPNTVERVQRALFRLNYFTDLAPEVQSKIKYKFDFIFPHLKTGYFHNFVKEIEHSHISFERLNTRVNCHMTDDLSPESLSRKLIEVGQDTDGIAFVALDHPLVRGAVDQLYDKGVAAISLVSDLSRSKRLAYVGLDNRAAGRTAGMLMGRFLSDKTGGTIALFPGRPSYRGHEERESGFKSMIRERFGHFDVLAMPAPQYDNAASSELMKQILNETDGLIGIYNTAGATEGIAEAIRTENKQNELVFIAHELTEKTRNYLYDNSIDVIINQNIRSEIFSAVETLVLHNKHETILPNARQTRVEIYLPENVQ